MPKALLCVALIFLVGSCSESRNAPVSEASPVGSGYQPFPAGYQYLERNEALTEAVKNRDHAPVREHGWYLWAGIMQPAKGSNWPIWYTWPNTKAAFAADKSALLKGAPQSPFSSMLAHNAKNVIRDKVPLPSYPVPKPVLQNYKEAVRRQGDEWTICDGSRFLFNGDILIPTESLSRGAMDWIRDKDQPRYKQSTLTALHNKKVHKLNAPQEYIVTKHMYWPVKAGGLSAIPVWRNDFSAAYTDYAGYEKWKTLIAVDPTGKQVGRTVAVKYLYGVLAADHKTALGPITAQAKVYPLDDFYHHKITEREWQRDFDECDKAVLNASSYWAYNQPFGPGDYLVTVAMHINTKEIPSWALQSVWWSDQPDAGPEAANRPPIAHAVGPWKHYKLVDSYGIPERTGGDLPVAMNPYIELAIHPVATNCQNCHIRAGWPKGSKAGQASYQNPDCPSLVAHLTPDSACLETQLLTDFQWIIPDRAIAD